MLATPLDKLAYLVVKAREFDAQVAPEGLSRRARTPPTTWRSASSRRPRTIRLGAELTTMLADLNDDEMTEVLALVWLGGAITAHANGGRRSPRRARRGTSMQSLPAGNPAIWATCWNRGWPSSATPSSARRSASDGGRSRWATSRACAAAWCCRWPLGRRAYPVRWPPRPRRAAAPPARVARREMEGLDAPAPASRAISPAARRGEMPAVQGHGGIRGGEGRLDEQDVGAARQGDGGGAVRRRVGEVGQIGQALPRRHPISSRSAPSGSPAPPAPRPAGIDRDRMVVRPASARRP